MCDASSEGRPVALLSLNQRHGTSTLHPCHPPMTPIPPPSLQTSLPLPPCLLPARISQLPTFPLPSTAIHNRHTQAHEAKSTCAARPPNEPTSRLHSSLSKTPPSNLASFWGSLQNRQWHVRLSRSLPTNLDPSAALPAVNRDDLCPPSSSSRPFCLGPFISSTWGRVLRGWVDM